MKPGRRAAARKKAEQAALQNVGRAALVFGRHVAVLKVHWLGFRDGAKYLVAPHLVRPLMNACASLARKRRGAKDE